MSSNEISKTKFKQNYNIVKILVTKKDIMDFVRSQYKGTKDEAVAFCVRKKYNFDMNEKLDLIIKRLDNIENRLDNIENRLDNIENRLDIVEQKLKRNNIR